MSTKPRWRRPRILGRLPFRVGILAGVWRAHDLARLIVATAKDYVERAKP